MRDRETVGTLTQAVFATLMVAATLCCGFLNAGVARAEDETTPGIYVIFDASGSMWQKLADGAFKIEVAKEVLREFMVSDFSGHDLAFRAYGHRRKGDCTDSELIVPFSQPDQATAQLESFLKNVNPTGKTPIYLSLSAALKDFGERRGEIILISDGEETCDTDPCALIREWREKNIEIRVHVVGLGLDEMSRKAMQCISEAAGTEYRDAQSAQDLATGLQDIQRQAVSAALKIIATDARGDRVSARGTLTRDGAELYDVSTHRRNVVDSGSYLLTLGIQTRNGTIHSPTSREIVVAEAGETVVEVEVARPATVRARFVDGAEDQRGSAITAYQSGTEVFSFRSKDQVYLDEGTYEFHAQPNKENDIVVAETFQAGDDKELVFEMVHTVLVKIRMVASESGTWFRQNYELWQDGEKKYGVHAHNGARVLPGIYDLHLPDKLTPYIETDLVVTAESEQKFEVTVPVGHVTIVYQNADGSRAKDKRCFVGNGPKKKGKYKSSGKELPLRPGTYNVIGWRGEYDRVVFDVTEGQSQEVVLRAK